MLQITGQKKDNAASRAAQIIPILLAAISGVLFFCTLYHINNKYTFEFPQASGGIMTLDADETPLIFLVDGWELYKQQLLEPSDLMDNEYTPDCYTFIGEYSGFEFDDPSASPYGESTYRMNILVPEDPHGYTLEVPEIYSACKIWINGELMYRSGTAEAEEYGAKTGNSFITFTAAGRIEIVIAVSNYTHYYGGMIYPPAFGDSDTVGALLTGRTIFTAVVSFIAYLIGLFLLIMLFFAGYKRPAAFYCAFCFFYANSVSYSLIHSLRFDNMRFWYSFEDFCYFGCLFALLLILPAVCPAGKWRARISVSTGAAMCVLCLILPPLISGSTALVYAYSRLVTGYKLLFSAFLVCSCVVSALRGKTASRPIASALVFFACMLALDAVVVLNEPLFWGRPAEWGGLAVLSAVAAGLVRDAFAVYKDRREYEEQNKAAMRMISLQERQFDAISEQIDSVKRARHDLRHHLSVMENFVAGGKSDELQRYLAGYYESLPIGDQLFFCENTAANAVICHYARLAREKGINTDIQMKLAKNAGISDHDLCGILGNLLENAVEACLRVSGESFIRVRCDTLGDMFVLTVENTSSGIFKDTGAAALSAKRGGVGTGVASVRKIVRNYNGTIEFSDSDGVFSARIALEQRLARR